MNVCKWGASGQAAFGVRTVEREWLDSGGMKACGILAGLVTTGPTFQLSRLREIGWANWDPIGVGGADRDWPRDEYDSYLLEAAGRLWHGGTDESVADYLVKIETEHMGLTPVPGIKSRALEVTKNIRDYVEALRS